MLGLRPGLAEKAAGTSADAANTALPYKNPLRRIRPSFSLLQLSHSRLSVKRDQTYFYKFKDFSGFHEVIFHVCA
jgi:hypothetical protein